MITNVSRIITRMHCPQRHAYSDWMGLETDKQSPALPFGTHIHSALAAWYGPGPNPQIVGKEGDLDLWLPCLNPKVMLDTYWASWEESGGAFLHDQGCKPTDSSGYGEKLLMHYASTYAEEDKAIEAVAGVELPVMAKVGRHRILGRLDTLVKWQGGWWHLQHKTMSAYRSVPIYLQTQALAWHEKAYALGVKQQYGIELSGSILNLVRKMVLKTTKTGRELWEDWQPFHREPLPTADHWAMNRFVRDVGIVLDDMERDKEKGEFAQHPTACALYNSLCPYIGLCQGQPLDEDWPKRDLDYVDEARDEVAQANKS